VITKFSDGLGRVTPTSKSAQRGHLGVVPTFDLARCNQCRKFALGRDDVGEAQPTKLGLAGSIVWQFELVEKPVVQLAVVLEFKRAERMGDTLEGIALAVGPVIVRVDTPVVAGAMMGHVANAVHQWVAHGHVGVGHVDLGSQHSLAIAELAGSHTSKQVKVLVDGAITKRAICARRGEVATGVGDRLGVLIVDVGEPFGDQIFGPGVELFEVITRIQSSPVTFETQPLQVAFDRNDEISTFLFGVGVVEPQIARAAEITGDAEVQTDRLGVTNMEIPIRFGRKTRLYPVAVGPLFVIAANELPNEIGRMLGLFRLF